MLGRRKRRLRDRSVPGWFAGHGQGSRRQERWRRGGWRGGQGGGRRRLSCLRRGKSDEKGQRQWRCGGASRANLPCLTCPVVRQGKRQGNQRRCGCDDKHPSILLSCIFESAWSRVCSPGGLSGTEQHCSLHMVLHSPPALRPPLLSFIPPLTYQGSPRQQPRPRQMKSSFSCRFCAKRGGERGKAGVRMETHGRRSRA